ncbi:MAG TPA: LuxR C-terminal-related transcriptional regulator [Steroidobacteraceae bacterium]|nr:LuxR C-terminal-related transcriptional regulator [Steroidobacteraceae bacterium]
MIHAVNRALAADRKRRAEHETVTEWQLLYESLTARERQVIALVSAGLRNKQVAADLGISEITAKVHRLHIMRKMRARSLADLVRIADALGIHRDKPGRI